MHGWAAVRLDPESDLAFCRAGPAGLSIKRATVLQVVIPPAQLSHTVKLNTVLNVGTLSQEINSVKNNGEAGEDLAI